MKLKKLTALFLSAAMILTFTACGSDSNTPGKTQPAAEAEAESGNENEPESESASPVTVGFDADYTGIEDIKIALIAETSGGSFWGNIEQGFLEATAARGWESVYWAPSDATTGDAGVLDLAETALIQGYNVICPVMNDISIFEDFLNRAREAGVLVIDFNADPGEGYVPAQVGIDSTESGRQQGEMIGKFATEMGFEEINYVNMSIALSNTPQQAVKAGALEGIAGSFAGAVNEVGEGESESNAATAQDAIGALFIAHPEINTIICCDMYSAVGAAAYIEESGLQGKVIACGLSLDADALMRVKSGALSATSSVDSVYMGGEQLCGVIEKITAGEEFEYKNFPPKIWVLPDEVDDYASENGITIQ